MADPGTRKKLILILVIAVLLFLSILYPSGIEINGVRPDIILVFIIMTTIIFDFKTIVFSTLLAGLIRDLVEFRFPGPYIITYFLIILLVYFAGSFFYKPGIGLNIFFVAVFTFVFDMIWITFYNVYYLLHYGVSTDFSYGSNIVNGTIFHMAQNIVIGAVMYYLIVYIKKRVLHEKA